MQGNVASKEGDSNVEDWRNCFTANTSQVKAMAALNFDDRIVDSECGHHLTRNGYKFYSLHRHKGNKAFITADNTIHHVEKEGSVINPITLTNSKRRKFEAKATKCLFIRYDERKKGWKRTDPVTQNFIVSRDVFDDTSTSSLFMMRLLSCPCLLILLWLLYHRLLIGLFYFF
ncbi:hypothetical protein Dimus_002941 [Dionaea muscipula]